MYIPTIFFNPAGGCIQPIVSGSNITETNGYYMGRFVSGSQTYFYLDIAANVTASFEIAQGITTTAKLLLIGGGGYAFLFRKNPGGTQDSSMSAGGAAGNVYFQDISLEPGTYVMKAGRGGFSSSLITEEGTESSLQRIDSSFQPIVAGGGSSTNEVGGNNSLYIGGTGIVSTINGAGGGGAGSTGNGTNAFSIGNAGYGGDGGSRSIIPAPFSDVFQSSNSRNFGVAGGGAGCGYTGNSGTPAAPNSYGSGGTVTSNAGDNGNDGRAIIYIPIGNCEEQPTGSLILPTTESFQAIGGDVIGTFVSSSVRYKYHLYYETGSDAANYFRTMNGYTEQAKILLVGGGAGGRNNFNTNGGAGAGKVAITRNITLYGIYEASIGIGGTRNNGGGGSEFISLSNFTNYYGANGGGTGADSISNPRVAGQNGGSGGGGSRFFSGTWQSLARGFAVNPTSPPYDNADEYYGNDGGAGVQIDFGYGGGGGGATTAGSGSGEGGLGYTLTGEFFPTNVLFTTASIARGGDRGGLLTHTTQPYSGDGGQYEQNGRSGFICITYPISGSTSNSPG